MPSNAEAGCAVGPAEAEVRGYPVAGDLGHCLRDRPANATIRNHCSAEIELLSPLSCREM
ncbi:MAG: hypothetical protein ACR2M5_12180 [Nakamurella sp.]